MAGAIHNRPRVVMHCVFHSLRTELRGPCGRQPRGWRQLAREDRRRARCSYRHAGRSCRVRARQARPASFAYADGSPAHKTPFPAVRRYGRCPPWRHVPRAVGLAAAPLSQSRSRWCGGPPRRHFYSIDPIFVNALPLTRPAMCATVPGQARFEPIFASTAAVWQRERNPDRSSRHWRAHRSDESRRGFPCALRAMSVTGP